MSGEIVIVIFLMLNIISTFVVGYVLEHHIDELKKEVSKKGRD